MPLSEIDSSLTDHPSPPLLAFLFLIPLLCTLRAKSFTFSTFAWENIFIALGPNLFHQLILMSFFFQWSFSQWKPWCWWGIWEKFAEIKAEYFFFSPRNDKSRLLFPFYVCSILNHKKVTATATAESLQSCPTLCDPIDGSLPGSPDPRILQARTLEWVAISFSNAWKWKVKVKSLSRVRLFTTPWTAAYQAPLSMGFSRQEYWSGVPLPSPEKVKLTINCFWNERVLDHQVFNWFISSKILVVAAVTLLALVDDGENGGKLEVEICCHIQEARI